MDTLRRCPYCRRPLPESAAPNAIYCSREHSRAAATARDQPLRREHTVLLATGAWTHEYRELYGPAASLLARFAPSKAAGYILLHFDPKAPSKPPAQFPHFAKQRRDDRGDYTRDRYFVRRSQREGFESAIVPFSGHYDVRFVDYQGKPMEHVEVLIELPGCNAVSAPPDPTLSERAKRAARSRAPEPAIIVEVRSGTQSGTSTEPEPIDWPSKPS